MPQAGFEPIIPASKRPQTHALDLAVNGIGAGINLLYWNPTTTDYFMTALVFFPCYKSSAIGQICA
jgi:hypothetical protein